MMVRLPGKFVQSGIDVDGSRVLLCEATVCKQLRLLQWGLSAKKLSGKT